MPDIVESFHRWVSTDPTTTHAALASLDPLHSLITALEALGLGERCLALRRVHDDGSAYVFGLILRLNGGRRAVGAAATDVATFDVPGHLKLAWTVSVEPDDDGASLISIALDAGATDTASREILADSWPLLGAVAEQHAHRILAAIQEYTDEAEEEGFDF